jgi:hypothetical protein
MTEDGRVGYTTYLKYMTAAALMIAWVLAAWTGFMLGVVPYAPGGGNETLMLGVTRAEWGVIHSWLSAAAVIITAVEIILTRKFLTEGLRHMAEARSGQAGE